MHRLNDKQQKAVENIEGPTLILAGAGTGKTKTLVSRICHILNENYALPQEIMAVTFTNKAAKEMQSRIVELTNFHPTWVGTFHSIAARILRKNAEYVNLTGNFTIIDQDDQLNLIKNIIADINPEYIGSRDSRKKIKSIANIIQRWKDKALTPDNIEVKNEMQRSALECYRLYQERLTLSNAVDFDDLILHNIKIFNNQPQVLELYQDKIKYIMVDEYQDTNMIQYLWLRLLAQKHKNICCVGDDDQSIYSWRGAEISNILKFSDDFPGAKVIKLEQNYRSNSHILAVAAAVIGENQDRLGKTLWTQNNAGPKVKLMKCYDHKEEARNIMSIIADRKEFKDTAILVRASAQTRPIEEYAIYYGVPYQIIGGLRFYDRKEIKDVISYLKTAANNNDDLAFERIVNVPKRGIGPTTLKKIYYAAISAKTSLTWAAHKLIEQKVIKSEKLTILLNQIDEWNKLSQEINPQDLTELILKSSGYIEMISQENEIEAISRKENIKELINALKDFNDIDQFLEYVALVTTADNNNNNEGISIMTLHAAKGLEFVNVFLPGWEEEIFPHQRCIKEGNVEEERRLAYVGITRAKENLCISFAERRFINHSWLSYPPSRFLHKLAKENVEI
ncbi:MAG: UvrD-helicase domain-containing protein [Rickettsiaceae bacterium H1]|nr:UvrD-helicase domain-containing protein [Rickettsiaceae bacterium H1]